MPRKLTIRTLLLAVLGAWLLVTGISTTLAATRTTYVARVLFELALDAGTIDTDQFETSQGYPAAFTILSAAAMSGVRGETDFASTFHVVPDWNFITGSSGIDQNYCAGCNGSFRLSFETTSETCTGSVLDGVYGVGLDIESHSFSGSPAGPYSAFVTYGDGTTENFNFPAGASFFGITSPDLINNIHVAVNNVPTGSGSITIDNLTLGNQVGGCAGASQVTLTKTASPSPAIAGQNLTYAVTATNDGLSSVENVVITDNLPANSRFVSAAPSAGGSCTTPAVGTLGGTVQCTWAGPVGPGESVSVNIVVGVCPEEDCGDTLTNNATVTFDIIPIILGPLEAGAAPRARAAQPEVFESHEAGQVVVIDGIPHTKPGAEGLSRSAVAVPESARSASAPDAPMAPGDVLMWGATSIGGLGSQLYSVDPATAGTTLVGTIGFSGVTGLEVLPDGRLVGSAHDNVSSSVLLDIDRTSGSGALIGIISNVSTGCQRMPDLSWNGSNSTLYGYGDFCGGPAEGLFTINTTTGAGTSVGASGFGGGGNGLAWDFTSNTVYGTPFDQNSLVTFNIVTGAGTSIPASIGNVPFRLNALAVHPVTGDLYGVWNGAPTGTGYGLVTVNKTNGVVTLIGQLPASFDAIAFEVEGGGGVGGTTLVTPIQAQSNLSITKTDSPDPVIAGNDLTYVITVNNLGPSNSAGTVVTDNLDPNVTFVSATVNPPGPTCSHVGGVVTCNLGVMGAPNQCAAAFPTSYQITIVVNVSDETPCSPSQCPGSPGGQLSNTASVTTANCLPDPVPGNNSVTILTDVLAGADVLIEAPLVVKFASSPVLDVAPDSEAGLLQEEECITAGDILEVTFTFSNTGPRAFTIQRDNPGPEFEAVHPPEVVGLPGTCTVIAGGGACQVDASGANWNGEIPVGASVTLSYRVRVQGGLPEGTTMIFNGVVNYDEFNIQQNTASRTSANTEVTLTCRPTVDPNSALAAQVHLPILNFQGQNDVCRTWIEVQNVGDEFVKAALVTWGEPGFCPPQCAGPLKVECTGLLKPGSAWNFLGAQIPSGSKSGMLFSFTARQLSQIGVNLGFDDIVADYMCETLFFGVVGDCDDFRRFKKAFNEGLDFAGVPLDRAIGEPLAVEVLRHCPGDLTPGAEVSSKYGGIAGIDLGAYDPVFGGFAYYVPLIYAETADFNTVMYIQNGGLECSSVEIWFKAQDDCLRARICEIFALTPGESFQWDANDCVGPNFIGNAWLRSSQPLGIAVDIFGRDVLMTYVGVPTELNYTFDPDNALFTVANQVAFGPLMYSEYQGWDSAVQVQNMSSVVAAKVKVYFLDRSGGVITTLVDWICPRGSQTYFLPVVAELPGSWVGSIRVESQEWFSPGDPLVAPPNITGIASLIKYVDAARSDTEEALAYNLLTEQRAFDWQVGANAGGTESGIGLIAIPSVIKDLEGTGVTTELAIANLVPKPGFTDFAIYLYDQNGLIDYVCQKLNERQVEYIDFDTWGFLNPGFKGSAIISATFWEHDVFDGSGFFIRNLLGLAAVVIERTGTRLGEDIPGDEAAGTTGIPFREDEVTEFFFDFEGPVAPLCPGQPGGRPLPDECAGRTEGLVIQITQGPPFQAGYPFTGAPGPGGNCDVNLIGGGAANVRNWGRTELNFCAAGEMTITADAIALVPFMGAACGGGVGDVIGVLYQGPEGHNPQLPCENHLETSFDGQFPENFNVGESYTYQIPAAGDYTFLFQNICDTFPPSSTGPVNFTLEYNPN